jgi:2-polyprenyl-3-methyl-5-hydroxy-6-metoxy-1,4-benzoquinol methylase
MSGEVQNEGQHEHPVREASEWDLAWSELEDYITHHPGARHRRRLIAHYVTKEECRSVLDVGCGRGNLLQLLYKRLGSGVRLAGTDFSGATLKANQASVPFAQFYELDLVEQAPFSSLPPGLQQQFQVVICSEVLEHLTEWRRGFERLVELTEPGGRIVVTTPSGPITTIEREVFGHLYHPTAEDYLALARHHGLQVVTHLNWGWPTYRLLKYLTNVSPERSMKNFGYTRYSSWQRTVCWVLYLANYFNVPRHRWGCQRLVEFQKVGEQGGG